MMNSKSTMQLFHLSASLRKSKSELPDLDKDGIDRVKNEALPAMQHQLDDINKRHSSAQQQRKAIERKWPDEDTTNEVAKKLINQIDITTSDQQERILKIKLTLEAIQLQINEQFEVLVNQITEAENTLQNPNASIEDLQRASEILTSAQPKLNEIDRLYKDLDADNETSQELKQKTADKLSKLNELFKHNQNAANDRIQQIIQKEHESLNAILIEGQQILSELPESADKLDDYNKRYADSVKSTQNLLQRLPSQNSEELQRLLDSATKLKRDLESQASKWNEFNELCQEVKDKQLKVEKAIDVEQEKGIQNLNDAQKTVKSLKNSLAEHNKIDYKLADLSPFLIDLQPNERAEKDVAFLENQQSQQQARIVELVADIESEIQNEKSANEEIANFIEDLRHKLDSLPSMSVEDAQKLHEESDPMKSSFDNLVGLKLDRSQQHQYVQSEWPSNLPPVSEIHDLIQKLKTDALKQSESGEADGKRRELNEEYDPLMKQIEAILHKYADSKPRTADEVRADADLISDLLAKLQPLRNRFQLLLQWLTERNTTPDQQLLPYIDQANSQIESLDNAQKQLSKLEDQIRSEIGQQDQLGRQKEMLSQKFNQLQNEASLAHEIEDPNKRQEELTAVQQRIQPLVEELSLVRTQLPQTERPILSATKENSQLLTRLHDDALLLNDTLTSGSKEAAKRAKLARIEHEAQLLMSRIAAEISGAELLLNVKGSPSMAQLRQAATKLDQLPGQMENANSVFRDLDESDEPTRQLKKKLADRLRQLQQLYNHNRKNVDDSVDRLLNGALGRLEELNQQASRLLENGTVNPNELDEYSALILSALQDSRPLVEDPTIEGYELCKSISKAEQNKHALDDLWRRWQPIRKQLDNVKQKQQDLSKLADLQGLRPIEEAKEDLNKLKNAHQDLQSLQPELDSLKQQISQLQAIKSAEPELVILLAQQQSLADKFNTLIEKLESEIVNEEEKQTAARRVSTQIQQTENELPNLNASELKDRRDNLLPQLQQGLQNVGEQSDRQFVDPQTLQLIENLTQQLQTLAANINTNLARFAEFERADEAKREWNEKKQKLSKDVETIEKEASPIFARYGSQQMQPANTAENDQLLLAGLIERTVPINAELTIVNGWLLNKEEFSEPDRQTAIEDLSEIDHNLKNNLGRYEELNRDLNNDLIRLKDLTSEYQQVESSLSQLEKDAKTEDPSTILQKLQPVDDQIQLLFSKFEDPSRIRPDSSLNIEALQTRSNNLRSDIEQQQTLKQMEASELSIEVDKLREAVEEKIAEASRLIEDPNASIDQLQQAADILDASQSKILTLKQLYTAQEETPTAENAELRHKIATILLVLQQRWLAKRREIASRIEALLHRLSNQLALLVSEGQRMLVDNTTHPDQFNEHANKLKAEIRQTESILASASDTNIGVDFGISDSLLASLDSAISTGTAQTTDPSVPKIEMAEEIKNAKAVVENASKVRDLLDAKWIIWAEFCKLREATYSKLEFLKKPLIQVQEKGLRSLDEAREDIKTLTKAQDDLAPVRDDIEELNNVAIQLDPQDVPHSETRFVEADFDENYGQFENTLLEIDLEVADEQRLREALSEVLDELQQISDRLAQLNYLELVELGDHVMPALAALLADIRSRHSQAEHRRQFVQRMEQAAIEDTERMADELLERIRRRADELRPSEEGTARPRSPNEPPLDYDAAADLLAMAFPDERPKDVLKRYGFDQIVVDSDEHSSTGQRTEPETMPADDLGPHAGPSSIGDLADEAIAVDDNDLALTSSPEPPPLDTTNANSAQAAAASRALQARQRNRWRRVLFAALPYQVMLALLLAAACMIPDLTKEQSCENLHKLFEIHQQFINGAPPM
ncbi:Spectrin beta chain, erythrocytic [Aphelenchoides bicaudatus]|nr:Spectrin beta chain, erythrocytic [Aphelenchoides bicaudatus]